jgi:hypothetical protein
MCLIQSQAWFECGGWYSTDSCEREFSVWSSEVNEQVLACVEHSACDELNPCIRRAWGEDP